MGRRERFLRPALQRQDRRRRADAQPAAESGFSERATSACRVSISRAWSSAPRWPWMSTTASASACANSVAASSSASAARSSASSQRPSMYEHADRAGQEAGLPAPVADTPGELEAAGHGSSPSRHRSALQERRGEVVVGAERGGVQVVLERDRERALDEDQRLPRPVPPEHAGRTCCSAPARASRAGRALRRA